MSEHMCTDPAEIPQQPASQSVDVVDGSVCVRPMPMPACLPACPFTRKRQHVVRRSGRALHRKMNGPVWRHAACMAVVVVVVVVVVVSFGTLVTTGGEH